MTVLLGQQQSVLHQLIIAVTASVENVTSVSDGMLDEVARALIDQMATMDAYKIDQKLKVDVIHEVLSKEIIEVNTMTLSRIERFEQAVMAQRPVEGGPSSTHGGARGYQLRIPDPKQWNLTVLKNGENGLLPWRKSFELEVRAIWAGLDVVLEALREETSPVGREVYSRLAGAHIPDSASPMDWV